VENVLLGSVAPNDKVPSLLRSDGTFYTTTEEVVANAHPAELNAKSAPRSSALVVGIHPESGIERPGQRKSLSLELDLRTEKIMQGEASGAPPVDYAGNGGARRRQPRLRLLLLCNPRNRGNPSRRGS
jgi:hypothetical protein